MLVVNTFVEMNLVYLVMHLVLLNFGRNMMVLQLSLYHHDNSGDGGSSFWPEYGGRVGNMRNCGIFCDNEHPKTESIPAIGSPSIIEYIVYCLS